MSKWPRREAYFWQTAPLFRILLPLMLGIAGYDRGIPAAGCFRQMVCVSLLTGLTLIVSALLRCQQGFTRIAFSVPTFVFFVSGGWCCYALSDTLNRPDYFGRHIDAAHLQLVRIVEEPREGKSVIRLTASLLLDVGEKPRPVSGNALIYLYRRQGMMIPQKGDTLFVPANWQLIRNPGNPFEFDNVLFQRRAGICYQQFLSPEDIIFQAHCRSPDAEILDRIHDWCNERLRAYINNPSALGLMQAMLLGDESAFDPELRQAYASTGVIHIVSISGSHVAVLFMVVTGLLFWIRGRSGAWIKYGLGLVLVWLYVLIAGAPPSALRSAIMFTVIALSTVSGREGQALNTLSGAGFLLLIGQPAWLFTVGFQLSFGAVLSILVFYKPICRIWPSPNPWIRKAWQAVAVSVAAEVLTAPLVIYYFHNFPLCFILANLLSGVLLGFCALTGGMAVIAFSWLPPVARLAGWLVCKLVLLFNAGIQLLQRCNPPSFQYLRISMPELLLLYLLIMALALLWLRRQKPALILSMSTALLLLILLSADKYHALKQSRLVVFNNGRQADVEIISGTHYSRLTVPDGNAFANKAAVTGWHAWRRAEDQADKAFRIFNGKRVLLLTDSNVNSFATPLPVDLLILARPLRSLRLGSMLAAFRPRDIVLATRPSAYQLRKWKDSCAAHGLSLHNVADEGAFILDEAGG